MQHNDYVYLPVDRVSTGNQYVCRYMLMGQPAHLSSCACSMMTERAGALLYLLYTNAGCNVLANVCTSIVWYFYFNIQSMANMWQSHF